MENNCVRPLGGGEGLIRVTRIPGIRRALQFGTMVLYLSRKIVIGSSISAQRGTVHRVRYRSIVCRSTREHGLLLEF